MKKELEKNKGITLIALVITIIVLLILAGVSIATLTGENGILTKAQTAGKLTKQESAKEKVQVEVVGSYNDSGKLDVDLLNRNLKNVSNLKYNNDVLSENNKIEKLPADVEINGDVYEIKEDGSIISVVNTIKPGEIITSEKGNTSYTNNGTAIIPVGFAIVPGLDDVSQGLVISDDANDTEIDKDNIKANGNQFVWIPVDVTKDEYIANKTYSDVNVSKNITYDTGYLPDDLKQPEKADSDVEKELVLKIKGFYISRYEAGDGSTIADRLDSSGTTGELVSKKDAYVYNYIAQSDTKLKSMKFINNKNVKSALISGVQWDMVMKFVNGKKDGNGNEYNVRVISDDPSTSDRHLDALQKCGQNEADKVCNIYDLEGNVCEWVAERSTYEQDNPVHRGGICSDKCPSSFAYNNENGESRWGIGFRFVLYVM